MAKKRSSGKITRRDAVTMLGAGAMLGGVCGNSEGAETLAQGPPCSMPANVTEFDIVVGGKTRLAMLADTCCEESQTAILAGTEVAGRKPTPNTKTHLKRLTDRLQASTLDEYCFMIWGLSQADVKSLYAMLPERLKMSARKTK